MLPERFLSSQMCGTFNDRLQQESAGLSDRTHLDVAQGLAVGAPCEGHDAKHVASAMIRVRQRETDSTMIHHFQAVVGDQTISPGTSKGDRHG